MHHRPNLRLPSALTIAALVAAGAAPARAQETMYGSTDDSSGGSLVIVDQETAAYTLVGSPLANGPTPAIAMDSDGNVWVSNNDRNNPAGKVGVLRRLDAADGSVVATVGTITDAADQQPLRISSMEFSPTDGRLYAVIARDDNIEGAPGGKEGSIVVIDTETALATVIGSTGLSRGGLAFSADGRLWLATVEVPAGFANEVLAQINPATGAVVGTPVELSLGQGIEGMAIRPSDGTFFAVYADGSTIFTLDPVTGAQVAVGNASGSEGSVADLTFRPSPPPRFGGLLLPEKVRVKRNAKNPARSTLTAKIRLDDCCSGLALGGGGTFSVGPLSFDLSTAKTNKRGTRLLFKGEGTKILLRSGIGGTSRGSATVKVKGDLEGVVGEGDTVAFALATATFEELTIVMLDDSSFDVRRGGAFKGANLRVDSLRARIDDPGGSSVTARLGVASIPAGAGPPDVSLAIGAYGVFLSDEFAEVSGTTFTWSLPDEGVRRLVLDTTSRQIVVELADVTLGYRGGPLTIVVQLRGEEFGITVTPRVQGSSVRY